MPMLTTYFGMESDFEFVLKFVAFAVLWVFPVVAVVVIFIGARRNNAAEHEFEEAHASNVIPFPRDRLAR